MIIKKTLPPTEGKLLLDEFYNSELKPEQFCKKKYFLLYSKEDPLKNLTFYS